MVLSLHPRSSHALVRHQRRGLEQGLVPVLGQFLSSWALPLGSRGMLCGECAYRAGAAVGAPLPWMQEHATAALTACITSFRVVLHQSGVLPWWVGLIVLLVAGAWCSLGYGPWRWRVRGWVVPPGMRAAPVLSHCLD